MVEIWALTTLSDLKDLLGISTNTYDALLENIINRTSGYMERFTGRRLVSTTYTEELYEGFGTRYLTLKQYPVTALRTFEYRDDPDFDSTDWQTVDASDYTYWDDGRVYYKYGFSSHPQKYRFTYVAGYLAGTHDSELYDLADICLQLARLNYTRRKTAGFKSETLAEYSYTMFDDDLKSLGLYDRLASYRTPTV